VFGYHKTMLVCAATLPKSQAQLLLYRARQPYEIARSRDLPGITRGEVLVQVLAIGLNPVDWKSAQVFRCILDIMAADLFAVHMDLPYLHFPVSTVESLWAELFVRTYRQLPI
jgi:hypothetical protein